MRTCCTGTCNLMCHAVQELLILCAILYMLYKYRARLPWPCCTSTCTSTGLTICLGCTYVQHSLAGGLALTRLRNVPGAPVHAVLVHPQNGVPVHYIWIYCSVLSRLSAHIPTGSAVCICLNSLVFHFPSSSIYNSFIYDRITWCTMYIHIHEYV